MIWQKDSQKVKGARTLRSFTFDLSNLHRSQISFNEAPAEVHLPESSGSYWIYSRFTGQTRWVPSEPTLLCVSSLSLSPFYLLLILLCLCLPLINLLRNSAALGQVSKYMSKKLNRKCLKDPTYGIFFISLGFKVPLVNPIHLGPSVILFSHERREAYLGPLSPPDSWADHEFENPFFDWKCPKEGERVTLWECWHQKKFYPNNPDSSWSINESNMPNALGLVLHISIPTILPFDLCSQPGFMIGIHWTKKSATMDELSSPKNGKSKFWELHNKEGYSSFPCHTQIYANQKYSSYKSDWKSDLSDKSDL